MTLIHGNVQKLRSSPVILPCLLRFDLTCVVTAMTITDQVKLD